MLTRGLLKNRKAGIFMEYAIMLGAIAMVFVAMNTYVKRGYQARLKDMTDYFVGTEQADTQDSEALAESKTTVEQEATLRKQGLGEGKTVIDLADTTKTGISSKTMVAEDPNYRPRFMDWESAKIDAIPLPDQPPDEEAINEQVSQAQIDAYQQQITELTAERDQILALANGKKGQAASLRAQIKSMQQQIAALRLRLAGPYLDADERRQIRDQISSLQAQIPVLQIQMKDLLKEAQKLDRQAQVLQAGIDAMQNELNQVS